MKRLLILAAALTCFGVWLLATAPASSHHNPGGKLPLVPFTWLIQTTLTDGEVRWCVDNRARDFPEFISDLRQVNDAATEITGIPQRQIQVNISGSASLADAKAAALAAGCMILHRIPDAHGCSGCAAWILYADRPAVVEYKLTVISTYNDLKTTQGHEGTNCGHAMGEHEGYIDAGEIRSHILAMGFWASPWDGPTVMDVGSHLVVVGGVWRCTENDRRLICSWLDPNGLRFTGCGYQQPPDCVPTATVQCWTTRPEWDGAWRWLFADGGSVDLAHGNCGGFYDAQNRLVWSTCDPSWGGRYNALINIWTNGAGPDKSTFHPPSGAWFAGGLALP